MVEAVTVAAEVVAAAAAAAERAAVATAATAVAAMEVTWHQKLQRWASMGEAQGCKCTIMRTFLPCPFGTTRFNGRY